MPSEPDPAGGPLLRRLRRQHGLSQQRLADVSGVSVRTVRGLENGVIHTPRLSSLHALGLGLGLDVDTTAQLVRGWSSTRTVNDYDDLTGRDDIMALLQAASLDAANRLRPIAITLRITIGAHRRVDHGDVELVLQATADDAVRMFHLIESDAAADAVDTTIADLRGVRLGGRLVVAEEDLIAFVLEFTRPLRTGDRHVVGYRIGVDPAHRETSSRGRDLGVATDFTTGTRSPITMLCLHLTFAGPRPETVYCLDGSGADQIGATLPIGPAGDVVRVVENVDAGHYGIGWTWHD